MNSRFYSVEYLDEEGEEVVRHSFMTDQQATLLIEEFARRGVFAQIHDLTPPQAVDQDTYAVLSGDEHTSRLDEPT